MDRIESLETTGFPMIEIGEEAGLRWGIALAPRRAAVNGYVQLPFAHPLFEKSFDQEILYMDFDSGLDVHGGVTYFKYGLIGFDTMHYRDVWTDEALAEVGGANNPMFPPIISSDAIYWTKDLIIEETKRLAKDLAEMM